MWKTLPSFCLFSLALSLRPMFGSQVLCYYEQLWDKHKFSRESFGESNRAPTFTRPNYLHHRALLNFSFNGNFFFKIEKPNIKIFLNQIKFGFKVPLAAYQPSAVSLYWMTSGAMAVLLNLLLMEPRLQLVTALI